MCSCFLRSFGRFSCFFALDHRRYRPPLLVSNRRTHRTALYCTASNRTPQAKSHQLIQPAGQQEGGRVPAVDKGGQHGHQPRGGQPRGADGHQLEPGQRPAGHVQVAVLSRGLCFIPKAMNGSERGHHYAFLFGSAFCLFLGIPSSIDRRMSAFCLFLGIPSPINRMNA